MDVPKASDVLANELRERILSGEFTEGTPLPPGRELAVQTRMSRATVREALRILEAQGLLRIRPGRAGGAFVRRPGKESVASSVGMLIRGRRIGSPTSSRPVRRSSGPAPGLPHATAPTTTCWSSTKRTGRSSPVAVWTSSCSSLDWHVAVATATHNEILTGIMTALSRAIYTATNNEQFIVSRIREVTAKAHRSITEAIRTRTPTPPSGG